MLNGHCSLFNVKTLGHDLIWNYLYHQEPPPLKKQPFSTCWLLLCDQSRDEKYTTCISLDDPDCRYWCSTGRRTSAISILTPVDHFNLSCLAENDGGFHRRTTSLWAHCADSCTPEQHVSEERCKKDARGMQEENPDTAYFYQHEFTGKFPEYHRVFLWSASQS